MVKSPVTPSSPAILGLQKTSLRVQAVDALRRAITTGELPAGTHVSEVEYAERLGISRGTLREAMRLLQQEGLLTEGSRGRLQVRHMDDGELVDVFAVRGALEALAARAVSEQPAPARASAVEALRSAIDGMHAAESTGGLDERIEADLHFHRELCRVSGNPTLSRTWESLEGSIRMSIMHSGIEKAVRNMVVDRHREIVDAIATGTPDAAAAAVRDHMRGAAQTLIA